MLKKVFATASVAAISTVLIQAPLYAAENEATVDRNNVICTNANVPPGEISYRTESQEVHVGNEENRVYGASGLTITVEKGHQWTTHGSVDASVSGDVSAIVAGIQAEVGVEVGVQKSVSAASSASWVVPEHIERGWVEPGNNGYQTTWIKGQMQAPCNWVELDRGTALVVTDQVSFNHSEGLIPTA